MTQNQKKLISLLREIFQFDQADLDFGIYRIMRMKRDEISRFIEDDLPVQITKELRELVSASAEAEMAEIDRQIADAGSLNISESAKASIIAELEAKKKALAEMNDLSSIEVDVYNHLTNFFSRYYDEGDFISQRRYKDGAYAIPYEGEEVKLYWANADQYYVKTSEYFKDYVFKTAYGDTVRFKLVEAEIERDNNKANEKRFFQLHKEKPFELTDGMLTVHMEYKNGGKTSQDECIEEVVKAFSEELAQFPQFAVLLDTTDGKTLLERQLKRYTARNTFDYFIHKNLGKFLRRELDFYIKNEVLFLDDIDEQDESKTKEYLVKAKVIRKIARKIIAFLAQIEDFQKKLYLKKKFVVETNYCITLDRIPEEFYPEIAANDAQREEWVRLFAIDKIEGELTRPGYSVPLTVDFLKANPNLLLDTAFFSAEFKEKLIEGIENLDENLDGLLIHSENFQALNLLQEKYGEKIGCIYIDPPYNTNASEILYKNGYKHSSWNSMIFDRLVMGKNLLAPSGFNAITIDYAEMFNLGKIADDVYGEDSRVGIVTIFINPKGRQHEQYFASSTEYMLVYAKDLNQGKFNKVTIDSSKSQEFEFSDEKGNYRLDSFIRARSSTLRAVKPQAFYPIYVSKDLSRLSLEPIEDGYTVLPVKNGIEYTWKLIKDSFDEFNAQGMLVARMENGSVNIYNKFYEQQVFHNIWTDKKYFSEFNGTNLLKDILGDNVFSYPKSLYAVSDTLKIMLAQNGTALDYFAGSGTTGHAVISLNREDGGRRKYILIEMGEYFDSVTKPRIEKVIYSDEWKGGKPVSRKGSSHAFKYLRLESYEDTLNNIVLKSGQYDFLGGAREGYLLSYMLDAEAEGSSCLINIDKLDKPFDYKMNITRNLESRERPIDLVETFNYLLGLKVSRSHALAAFDADFTVGEYGAVSASLKNGGTYRFKSIEGTLPNGDKALVIWREMTGDTVKDNAVLDAYFRYTFAGARGYRKIFVNCDNNLENLRAENENWRVVLIDEEIKKRLFEYRD